MRRQLLGLTLLWLAVGCAPKPPESGVRASAVAAQAEPRSSTPEDAGGTVAAGDARAIAAPPPDAGTPSTAALRPLVVAEVLALRADERTCVTARESSGRKWIEVAFDDADGNLRRIVYLKDDEQIVGWMQVLRYDAKGNVTRIDSIDATGQTTASQEFSFDAQGILQHFMGASGMQHTIDYEKPPRAGEVFVRAERLPWRWIRDTIVNETPDQFPTTGWISIFDQPNKTGSVEALRYDAHGRVVERKMYLGGAVVRGAPPSTDTTYVRDGRGRLLEARIKNNETSKRARETYSWKADRLVRVARTDGEVRELDYDAAGRLIRARIKSGKDVQSETTFDHACPRARPRVSHAILARPR